MKIALFVPSWPPGANANGIVTYASQLVPALRRLGHEVFVVAGHGASDDGDPHLIDLRRFASRPSRWQRAMFKLAPALAHFDAMSSAIVAAVGELVDRENADVFEMEESFGWSYAASRLNLLPVVVRLHGPWFLNGRYNDPGDRGASHRHRSEWEGRGIQIAHFITAPSEEVLRAVEDHYGFNSVRSRVIRNPLDVITGASKWDIKECSPNRILFVGRFDKRKGGDLALRAFAKLALAYPKLELKFVGPDRGIVESKNVVLTFNQFIQDNRFDHCRSHIEFLGEIDHCELMALRATCFCTIVTSQYEIMPYSVLEAMSVGCPLVATAVGGIPELIKNQHNGLLVPSQDEEALISACRTLLDDHTLAARLGGQARRDCRSLYSSENIARQTIAAYQEAVDAFKAPK